MSQDSAKQETTSTIEPKQYGTREQRHEWYRRCEINDFGGHIIECLHGQPLPHHPTHESQPAMGEFSHSSNDDSAPAVPCDTSIRTFRCHNPQNGNHMAFWISFIPGSIHINGDLGSFTVDAPRRSYGLKWLLQSIKSEGYVYEKIAKSHCPEIMLEAEIKDWVAERIKDEQLYIEDLELRKEEEGADLHHLLDCARESYEEIDQLRKFQQELDDSFISWDYDILHNTRIQFQVYDLYTDCVDASDPGEDLDLWTDWSNETHIGFMMLRTFCRLYRQTFL